MAIKEFKVIAKFIAVSAIFTILMSSCGTHKVYTNIQEIASAAIRLDTDISLRDNHKLYIEASKWIGTPYRYGGNTKKGVDCSGLTSAIYKSVYKKKLERTADKQRTKDCKWIFKSSLKEGDLVFFHSGNKRKGASHVGIYL